MGRTITILGYSPTDHRVCWDGRVSGQLVQCEALHLFASLLFSRRPRWSHLEEPALDDARNPVLRIEVLHHASRYGDYYSAIIGGKFCNSLCEDEVLGVVAAAIYGAAPPYLSSYEEWLEWATRCGLHGVKEPVAMLTYSG